MSKTNEVRAMLADHETRPIQLLINAFLTNTGEKLIHVDKRDPESSGSPRRHRIRWVNVAKDDK